MSHELEKNVEPIFLSEKKEWQQPELISLGAAKNIEGVPGCGSDGCGTHGSLS